MFLYITLFLAFFFEFFCFYKDIPEEAYIPFGFIFLFVFIGVALSVPCKINANFKNTIRIFFKKQSLSKRYFEKFNNVLLEIAPVHHEKVKIFRSTFFKTLIFVIILVIFAINHEFNSNLKIQLIVFHLIFISSVAFLFDRYMYYHDTYKNYILSAIIKAFNPNLKYKFSSALKNFATTYQKAKAYDEHAKKLLNKEHINESAITTKIKEEYINASFDGTAARTSPISDYVYGEIDEKTSINFAELSANHYKKTFDKRLKLVSNFSGVFSYTNLSKDVVDVVRIASKNFKLSYKNKINLDSSTFEELFNVYTDNQIFATRLLSSDIMELLIDFSQNCPFDFEIVFKNNFIYLRFLSGNILDANIFSKIITYKKQFYCFSILDFTINLTKLSNEIIDSIEN